jgi:hypothetical protein
MKSSSSLKLHAKRLSAIPAEKLASAQAQKLAHAAKKDNWSQVKVASRSNLFSFARADQIHILNWPEL